MHLKEINLKGFKSFASSTTLELKPGITCIVGPNGSGKSNVVDALAWVMGEQGAKTLRGSKMEDVIFAGSDGKSHALGRAEVSLTIDNSDGKLPIEYSEVSIKRTLFRGGGSEYQINGESCRLLDIQELLSDTGLGAQMHVIVGQGRLDTILNATPIDRRGFIEEAAGVLKYRKRKEKAEHKLSNMQANLMRLTDLTFEVGRQLGPLGRQADVAKRANTIQATARDAKLRIYADDYVRESKIQEELITKITEQQQTLKKIEDDVKNYVAKVTKLEENLTSKELQEISEELHNLNSLKQKFENIKILAISRQDLLSQSNVLLFEGQDPKYLQENLTKAKKQLEDIHKKEVDALKLADDSQLQRKNTEDEISSLAKKIQIIRQNSTQRKENITKILTKIASNKDILEEVKVRAKTYQSSKKEIEKQTTVLQNEIAQKNKELEVIKDECDKIHKTLTLHQVKIDQTNQELQECKNSISLTSQDIAATNASIKTFEETLTQKVGKDSKLSFQDIKKNKISDTQFTEISKSVKLLESIAGSDFLIAPNQKIGYYASELSTNYNVVVLDNGKVQLLSYDNKTNDSQIIPIHDKIAELKKMQNNLEKKLVKFEEQRNSYQVNLDTKQKEFQKIDDKFKNLKTKQTDISGEINLLQSKLDGYIRELNQNDKQLEIIQERQNSVLNNTKDLNDELKQLEDEPIANSENLQESIDLLARAEVELNSLREKEQSAATNAASLSSTRQALQNRCDELEREYQNEVHARDEQAKQNEKRKFQIVQAKIALALADICLGKLQNLIEKVSTKKEELLISQTSQSSLLTDMRLQLKEKREIAEKIKNQLHNFEIQKAEHYSHFEVIKEKIDEELEIPIKRLVDEYGPDQEIKTPNEEDPDSPIVTYFNRELYEKIYKKAQKELLALGKVNPLALEEFHALQERHKYLTNQLEDLEKSRAELLTMIEDIDQKTIDAFLAAFTDTAKQFEEEVFPILFPGGKGKMVLSDPQNPLTTGIEIFATPAGKRISRLSLLSGGERSLVAVAMLVSIFKARPSPFYVMDEVEAALDDINLSRLLAIFSDLKKTSQLLIVTHQKRTMEVADALYGITMRQDGITKVISQDVSNLSSTSA